MLHTSVFDDIGLFDESLPACEDYDFWLRFTANNEVLFIDECLLAKTGGHSDQLSQRHPVMDIFRLQSLAGLLTSEILNQEQTKATEKVFKEKYAIVTNGAIKRGHTQRVHDLNDRYRELLDSFHQY